MNIMITLSVFSTTSTSTTAVESDDPTTEPQSDDYSGDSPSPVHEGELGMKGRSGLSTHGDRERLSHDEGPNPNKKDVMEEGDGTK